MGFLIGLLTVFMILDCVVLILLVLIQLPKKEAGAGLAFGAGTTDALFGAGSGTVLTKITKYASAVFFVLAILLSLLRSNYFYRNTRGFQQNLTQPAAANPIPSSPAAPPKSAVSPGAADLPMTPSVTSTANTPLITAPAAEATNAPAATNPANASQPK
jgi:preprotein translocase subunit SecG